MTHQVWCVAYDGSLTMEGPQRIRTGSWKTLAEAQQALEVVKSRSHYAPKANLSIETRFVSEWITVIEGTTDSGSETPPVG